MNRKIKNNLNKWFNSRIRILKTLFNKQFKWGTNSLAKTILYRDKNHLTSQGMT